MQMRFKQSENEFNFSDQYFHNISIILHWWNNRNFLSMLPKYIHLWHSVTNFPLLSIIINYFSCAQSQDSVMANYLEMSRPNLVLVTFKQDKYQIDFWEMEVVQFFSSNRTFWKSDRAEQIENINNFGKMLGTKSCSKYFDKWNCFHGIILINAPFINESATRWKMAKVFAGVPKLFKF